MNVSQWYAENINKFPDLVEGECSNCGTHAMMIDRVDCLECYHCGYTEILDS